MNILAVDDDLNMRDLYELWLADEGQELAVAESHAAAVKWLRSHPVDLVLLDLNLSGAAAGTEGLDLLETIRTYSPWAVVYVVSGAHYHAIPQAFSVGVDDYLIKDEYLQPLLRAKIALVERLVQQRRQGSRLPQEREAEIARTWLALQEETDSARKGRLLEDFLVDVFKSIPGVRSAEPRVKNALEEIDVVVIVDGTGLWSPFQATPHVLVECKHWSNPVGRAEMDVLVAKLKRRHSMSKLGILVAWSGVTEPLHRVAVEAREHVVVVLDRERLAKLVAASDRAALLQTWIDRSVMDREA